MQSRAAYRDRATAGARSVTESLTASYKVSTVARTHMRRGHSKTVGDSERAAWVRFMSSLGRKLDLDVCSFRRVQNFIERRDRPV